MKLAVIGATGLVGQKILQVLEERKFPVSELFPVASARSVGKSLRYGGNNFEIMNFENAISRKPDIAFFSAGKDVSLTWANAFVEAGCTVIDNSSAWRMHENIKLVVPEINGHTLGHEAQIIANPNCSTIQLVAVLYPLHQAYGLKRVIVSTYQSVSGSGYNGLKQLSDESNGIENRYAYPHQIYMNCLPHGGNFLPNDYTDEEMKLLHESRKIIGLPDLALSGTVVRVPVVGGHSESVNIEFIEKPDIAKIREILARTSGIIVQDKPADNLYPMPVFAEGKDDVFVGRIRADLSHPNAINLWIVSDNLRKGAATNAVQIAEYLINQR